MASRQEDKGAKLHKRLLLKLRRQPWNINTCNNSRSREKTKKHYNTHRNTKSTYREQQKSCNITTAQRGRTVLEKTPRNSSAGTIPLLLVYVEKQARKKKQVNHQQENIQEKKSTYDDPWRRLMMMTESRLSRKSSNPYKHKHTKQKRALNPNYEI